MDDVTLTIVLIVLMFSPLIIPFVFYFIGLAVKSSMRKSIIERESKLNHILLIADKKPPVSEQFATLGLVKGETVVGVDYFSFFLATWKTLIGGRLGSMGDYLLLARREAVLRLKEEAETIGGDTVVNIRFETSRISVKYPVIEVTVYGTALKKK